MAVDLGFFTNTDEMYEDYSHFVRTKNLAWSLFVTDRLLALSTGRPCTVRPSLFFLLPFACQDLDSRH